MEISMKLGYRLGAAALSLGMAVVAFAPALADAKTTTFHIVMSGKKETPPHDVPGKGWGKAVYDDTTHTLTWHITYKNLTGPAIMAHFHGPAMPGKAAPVIVPIDMNKLASPIDGSAVLTDEQQTELFDGLVYFNVHTAANKSGEIRGQLVQVHGDRAAIKAAGEQFMSTYTPPKQ
jgi:hypothetical protein